MINETHLNWLGGIDLEFESVLFLKVSGLISPNVNLDKLI